MNNTLRSFYARFKDLLSRNEGQDVVEYALIVALIALAATAGMKTLATAIDAEFSALGTTITNGL
jgi:pilus assembly protein Flp/PilA